MRALPLILALSATLLAAGTVRAAPADEAAVLAPLHKLFDGMARRDTAAMLAAAPATTGVVLLREGKLQQVTMKDFAGHVAQGRQTFEERIHDPVVHVDRDLAVVWAPYEFLLDGKVDHCGTDAFTLAKLAGGWVITGIADNGRKDCK
jgi:hypothetical protein